MNEYIMTGRALAAKCVDIAQRFKTIYGYAMYGFQITDKTIQSKAAQNLNGWYTQKNIKKLQAVANQKPPVWGFDCVNLIKAVLWGWWGNEEKEKGGAVYASNGIPDTNADGMIARCSGVTDDFSSIEVGEAVWMSGHIGVYIGDGLAVECTPSWEDGVQITAVHNIRKQQGFHGRTWVKHGRLPHVDYELSTEEGDTPVMVGERPEYALGSRLLKRGCYGEDVRELQSALIRLGFSCGNAGADADFGRATEKAVVAFQTVSGLIPDGKFGALTYEALKAALDRLDSVEQPEPRYTVTIRRLLADEASALKERWPDCEIIEEA